MVIAKDKNGKITSFITQIIPTTDFRQKKNYQISKNSYESLEKDFSGVLLFKDWNETVKGGFSYLNGNREGSLSLAINMSKANARESFILRTVTVHSYDISGVSGTFVGTTYKVTDCITQQCFDPMQEMGYHTAFAEIKDQLIYECFKLSYNDISLGNTQYAIKTIMEKIFANTAHTTNIAFRDNKTPDYFTEPGKAGGALALTQIQKINDVKYTVIQINPVCLTFPKEKVTSILLHEIIHAFLMEYSGSAEIFDSQLAQHQEILNDWVINIRGALLAIYPYMDPKDASALALQGMEDLYTNSDGTVSQDRFAICNQVSMSKLGMTMKEANDRAAKFVGTPCK